MDATKNKFNWIIDLFQERIAQTERNDSTRNSCGRNSRPSMEGEDLIEVDQYLFAVEVGDKEQAVLVVPEANPVFEPSVRFAIDGLTEKV